MYDIYKYKLIIFKELSHIIPPHFMDAAELATQKYMYVLLCTYIVSDDSSNARPL